MLEGGVAGAFTDRYLFSAGHVKLLLWIMHDVFPWRGWWIGKIRRAELRMICNGVQELGFTQLEHTTLPAGNAGLTLALLAIAEDQQSQKIGSWAVSAVIQEMPESVILEVYCTKYARAMQRLLHQLRFTRHKILVNRLVRFTSRKPA